MPNLVPATTTPVPVANAVSYTNPLQIALADGTSIESCPDPSIIHGQQPGDTFWYIYCTNEIFHDGSPLHLIPISKSQDLVHWTYSGDVFQQMPSWVAADGGVWAPDIQYFNGKYYLYYAVSNTTIPGSAIFVVTSSMPTGPWNASTAPVVASSSAPCCSGLRMTIDPAVAQDDNGQRYIFYGTYTGGISARTLSADGMSSLPETEVQIAVPNRYEAPYIVKRNGYFYLFVSASNCCNGPLTGYAVFAGRSQNILGPYMDRDGFSLLDARVGGTPTLVMNGNRFVGPGHNAILTDAAGQDWMLYHAVDLDKPFFANGWTRRPVMLDAIDWIDGWPRVRNQAGPSDNAQTAPVVVAGHPNAHVTSPAPFDTPGAPISALSDEFSGSALSRQWSWIRPPAPTAYAVAGGTLRFDTQPGALYVGSNNVSILTEAAPSSDYVVEVKLSTSVPVAGDYSFVQGGVLIYGDDNNYVKLVDVAIAGTRQIEFGKQTNNVPANYPQYGSTLLASPADSTYLRIVKRSSSNGGELYTAYSSHDGANWERGGTWTHSLGSHAKIGLVSMNGAGFSTYFDYVRVNVLVN
ncbi:MAG TPA: family 43 glycosylhydrolase [Terriglobales bacterium]|nr:family 43 glycosylhydrolase [Terriglobales bacterium]